MKEVAGGNLAVAIQGCDRGDEIGEMARAVEVFKTYGLEKNRLEAEQKDMEARAAAQGRNASARRFVRGGGERHRDHGVVLGG